MTTFCPPICRKKLECPMKVTPSSPFETSRGLWVLPVRGVTTECRTRRVNSPARLRRARFFNEDFNIGSTSMIRSVLFDPPAGNADYGHIIGYVGSSL